MHSKAKTGIITASIAIGFDIALIGACFFLIFGSPDFFESTYGMSFQEMMEGIENGTLDYEELYENIEKYSVYARITNAERSRIVEAWKSKGHCVAVTGDSVDDVPSLMAADIGYSMGKSGTDVSKGVSDIILLDDDFSSIVYSIKEGRAIFANVRKTVNFFLGSNSAVFFFMILASLIFGSLPITALLLLVLNLVINIFPIVSLGMEPPETNIMLTAPQRKQAVFTKDLFINAGIQMLSSTVFAIIAFAIGKINGSATAMTMAFIVLSLAQVFFTLTARTENTPVFFCLFKNRIPLYISLISALLLFLIVTTPICGIFGLASLTAGNWILAILFAALPCLVAEIYKTVKYFKAK
jgi:Ca2+-transporting ATPase